MNELRVFVPGASALAVGSALVFRFRRGRQTLEGFVLRISEATPEGLVAFANECPHWWVDLDLGDRRFWDDDTGRILCKNHGALFHPTTGLCELGPCVGLSLEAFRLTLDGDGAWVTVPDAAAIDDPEGPP